MATPPVLAFAADGLPFRFNFWLYCLRLHLRCYIRDGVSLLEHTLGSLLPPTTPTEPAADADEDVQRRYRADSLAYRQWTECDAVAQRAVRSLLPVDQRDHFQQPETPLPLQLRECFSQRRVPGGVEASSLGACEPGSTVTAPVEALHTFTLDSGATRCFFRDCTTVTPLTAPVPVSLADPSGDPVVARSSTVLPCPGVPSGSLTGFHLPLFSKNLVSNDVLQDQFVTVTTSGGELVVICQVAASGQFAASCSCRLLSHQTLLWHHQLGHPSLPRLRGMHSRLPRSLPPLPRWLAPPCLPCVEGQQRAAPHSSKFSPTTAPLQTIHMDVWGPARVRGQDQERYFLLVVDDYTRYTTVFPLRKKADVRETSPTLHWMREVGDASAFRVWGALSLVCDTTASKLSPQTLRCVFLGFPTDAPPWQFYFPVLRRVLSSQDDTFDESVCFYRLHPHTSSPLSPPPLFLVPGPPPVDPLPPQGPSPSGVSQVDPPPLVEPLEVSSDTSGLAEGGDPAADDTATTRHSPHLETPPGFPPRLSSPPPQPVAVGSGGAGGAESRGAESGGAGSGGAESGGVSSGGADTGGARGARGAGAGGARDGGAGAACAGGAGGAGPTGAGAARAGGASATGTGGAGGASAIGSRGARAGGTGGARAAGTGGVRGAGTAGAAGAGGAGATGAGGPGGTGAAGAGGTRATGAGGARAGDTGGARVAGAGGDRAVGAGGTRGGGAGAGGAGSGGACAGGAGAAGAGGARAAGAVGAGARGTGGAGAGGTGTADGTGTMPRRLFFYPQPLSSLPPPDSVLHQVLSLLSSTRLTPPLLCPPTSQTQPQLLPGSPLPAPSPRTEVTASLTARHEPETSASTPTRARRVPRPCPPAVPSTHVMALRPSSVPQHVALPSPPASSLPDVPDPESDLACAASPTVTRLLATIVTNPDFESTSALP
ncbi:unnamed protein product [Closterium sp. NIES-54]